VIDQHYRMRDRTTTHQLSAVPATPRDHGPAPGLTALIVENSGYDVDLVVGALEDAGYRPLHWRRVEDSAGMKIALAEEIWDVVISEDRMPAFDSRDALAMLRDSAAEVPLADPSLAEQQPYKAIIARDPAFFAALGVQDPEVVGTLLAAFSRTWKGTTPEEFDAQVREWLTTVKQPKLGIPYVELVYKPMLELLDYLRAREFRVFLASTRSGVSMSGRASLSTSSLPAGRERSNEALTARGHTASYLRTSRVGAKAT
jgi:hypothetical protein